jgi:hypothetical protein
MADEIRRAAAERQCAVPVGLDADRDCGGRRDLVNGPLYQ